MKFGLKENTIRPIHSVLANYPEVEKAVLYGSRAQGNYRNGSDIDLVLMGGDSLTMKILYRIMDDLDDLLLPYTIDVSIFHQINDPDLIDHIKHVGAVFYEKNVIVS
jgi:predicted nucleotidyltransferase